MPIESYTQIIKERLGPERFRHSMNVANEAKKLAKKYGANPNKAEIAGIFHDICKEATREEQLQILQRYGVSLSDIEKSTFNLWHAISGSTYVRNVLHIWDNDIYNAIRYHTSGRAGMSLLEKVVFVADFTSKERNYPEVGKIREYSKISLEKAMKLGLRQTIRELLSKNSAIAPLSIAAYNELVM